MRKKSALILGQFTRSANLYQNFEVLERVGCGDT
jgi:hypothetical protein